MRPHCISEEVRRGLVPASGFASGSRSTRCLRPEGWWRWARRWFKVSEEALRRRRGLRPRTPKGSSALTVAAPPLPKEGFGSPVRRPCRPLKRRVGWFRLCCPSRRKSCSAFAWCRRFGDSEEPRRLWRTTAGDQAYMTSASFHRSVDDASNPEARQAPLAEARGGSRTEVRVLAPSTEVPGPPSPPKRSRRCARPGKPDTAQIVVWRVPKHQGCRPKLTTALASRVESRSALAQDTLSFFSSRSCVGWSGRPFAVPTEAGAAGGPIKTNRLGMSRQRTLSEDRFFR
jgi:hypothetical protein